MRHEREGEEGSGGNTVKLLRRWLFNLAAAVSLMVLLGLGALWVRTEWMNRYETFDWSKQGTYYSLELSSDDLDFRVLSDPGFAPAPVRRHTTNGGWVRPPPPTNPAALPPWSNVLNLPHPRSGDRESRSVWWPHLGFDYAEFDGWYGPGTTARAYRISYFVGMIPAGAVCLLWGVMQAMKWYRASHRPGFCPKCGYDLRATPLRCPECGLVPDLGKREGMDL